MGADAPIPPIEMNCRRPEGRPAAASISFYERNLCQSFLNRYYRGITCAPAPLGAGLARGGSIAAKTMYSAE